MYHYNYSCGTFNAVFNYALQIQWVLQYVDQELFNEKFIKSCDSPSYPPNARHRFDYNNPKSVLSAIEKWQPDGTGEKQAINCTRWNGDNLTWLLYWMQNIPGANNNLSCEGQPLTNWWSFIGDFDMVMKDEQGLFVTKGTG